MQTCSLRDLNSFLRGKFEKKLYQEPGAHQLFVRICICICIWARTSLKPIYIFKSEHRHLPYNFSIFPWDTFFRILEGGREGTLWTNPTSIPPSTNGAFLPRPQGLLLNDFKKTDSPARSCPPFRSGKTYSFPRYGREVVEALCFVLFHITFWNNFTSVKVSEAVGKRIWKTSKIRYVVCNE